MDDPTGVVVLRRQVTEATFRICDFGFGPHTLRVGINECLPVAISNLRVRLGSPISLKVIPNVCSYRDMRSACMVYFRVVDEAGRPIPDANLFAPIDHGPLPHGLLWSVAKPLPG